MPDNKEVNLEFVIWLTGHDKETVLQMHNDWLKSHSQKEEDLTLVNFNFGRNKDEMIDMDGNPFYLEGVNNGK